MSHPIFRTSQHFTPLHFDVTSCCFVAECPAGRTPQNLHEERKAGTLLPFLSLLLGIAVLADVDHAS